MNYELKQLIHKAASDRAFKSDSPGDVYAAYTFGAEAMIKEIESFTEWVYEYFYQTIQNRKWVRRSGDDAKLYTTSQLLTMYLQSKVPPPPKNMNTI